MFQRVGAAALKPDLTNTLNLCAFLGDPHQQFQSVHIAGTNGKGSSAHMIAAIMQSAGYKTGLYTSPHLKEFTERIKINGQEIPQQFTIDFVERIKPAIQEIKPSFFEITVLMAFDYFAQEEVDIAIIETGLGGRLDSTNVITPLVSLITNIGYDHQNILGNSLTQIASEKAGIIKQNVPVVIGQRQAEVVDVFISEVKRQCSKLYFSDQEYSIECSLKNEKINMFQNETCYLKNLAFENSTNYQRKNLPGVIATIEVLKNYFKIDELDIRNGLANYSNLTGLKGRWQKLQDEPTTYCDVGHNEAGIQEIVDMIQSLEFRQLHIVLGMVNDKDTQSILKLWPKDAHFYFCQPKVPRGLSATELYGIASEIGLNGEVIEDVNEAVQYVMRRANADDFVFVGGSTFVVAELNDL